MSDPNLQRLLTKAMLSLPTPLLRFLSGGGVAFQDERTLDPRFQFLARAASVAAPIESLTPPRARQRMEAAQRVFAGRPEPGVRSEELVVDGPGGPLRLRAYRPSAQDLDAPLMVFAHAGGGVIGDLETSDSFCRILAKVARCAVLSVDYRLAPEHRFPAGLEDTLAAYRWARENTARFGAPAGRVAVGGDSMGGNFAAVVAQEMKRLGEPQPALQLLIYPCVDMASETQSMTTFADAYPLSRPAMEWFMGHYLSPDADPGDLRASPIGSPDLSNLAPAVIATAGFDPLVDQGEAYAKRLDDAGVPVIYRCYEGLIHGFAAFTGAAPAADIACREIAGLTREGFEGRIP